MTSLPLKNGRVPGLKPKSPEEVGLQPLERASAEPQGTPEQIAKLEELQALYQDFSAQEILAHAINEGFAGDITAVSSFGAESVVLLHLIAQVNPDVPVLFLNTGKLFGETLRYRDRVQDLLGLTDIRSLAPRPADVEDEDPKGILWTQSTDACCHIRKVLPLARALEPFAAQITGRKRFQTGARAEMNVIELVEGRFRINPLASWSLDDLNAYMETHNLPRHPLVVDGYLSIGCMPCTERAKDGDYRSGRWAGSDKDECGIHYPIGGLTDGDGI